MKTFLKLISVPFQVAFIAGAALLTTVAVVTVLAAILTIAMAITSGAQVVAARQDGPALMELVTQGMASVLC